jgi:post-segregation antitoxin (ccd killing protein)
MSSISLIRQEDAMRTTLAIDDDVLAAAKDLAEREHRSIGVVISALAHQGLAGGARTTQTERNGIPLLPQRKAAVPVTLELVNELRDEPVPE